jgi:hypothetical protein
MLLFYLFFGISMIYVFATATSKTGENRVGAQTSPIVSLKLPTDDAASPD